MAELVCARCGHKVSSKSNLLQHLRRNKPCDAVLSDIDRSKYIEELLKKEKVGTFHCRVCNKTFTAVSNMYRHEKQCKQRHNDVKEQIEALKAKLSHLEDGIASGITNNTYSHIVHNNIAINVQLRNFGQENLAAIPPDLIRGCVMNFQVRELLENLHFDPQYPENNNVRLVSQKYEQLEMFQNDKWKTFPFKRGIPHMLQNVCRIFRQYCREYRDDVLDDMGVDEFMRMEEKMCSLEDETDPKKIGDYWLDIAAMLVSENRRIRRA